MTKAKLKETTPENSGWNVATKGKKKKNENKSGNNNTAKTVQKDGNKNLEETAVPKQKGKEPNANKKKKIRIPRSAAVIITPNTEKGITRGGDLAGGPLQNQIRGTGNLPSPP